VVLIAPKWRVVAHPLLSPAVNQTALHSHRVAPVDVLKRQQRTLGCSASLVVSDGESMQRQTRNRRSLGTSRTEPGVWKHDGWSGHDLRYEEQVCRSPKAGTLVRPLRVGAFCVMALSSALVSCGFGDATDERWSFRTNLTAHSRSSTQAARATPWLALSCVPTAGSIVGRLVARDAADATFVIESARRGTSRQLDGSPPPSLAVGSRVTVRYRGGDGQFLRIGMRYRAELFRSDDGLSSTVHGSPSGAELRRRISGAPTWPPNVRSGLRGLG
jgi:hypothetical protein